MLRSIVAGLAILMCVSTSAFSAGAGDAARTAVDPAIIAEWVLERQGRTDYANDDVANARSKLTAAVASPSFTQLSSMEQANTLSTLGLIQLSDHDPAALRTLRLATDINPSAAGYLWHARLQAGSVAKNYPDVLFTLTTMAQRWPDSVNQLPVRFFTNLLVITRADPSLSESRLQMLLALRDARWRPASPFLGGDRVWYELASDLLDRGRVQEAIVVSRSIQTPTFVEYMLVDKRFDPVIRSDSAHYDFQAVIDRNLEQLRKDAAAAPDQLDGVNVQAFALIQAGKPEEALTLLDAALARIHDAGATSPFKDMSELIWLMNERATALLHLRRDDEALAQMQAASEIPENGHRNMSQLGNLAEMYEHLGQPLTALELLRKVDDPVMSPYSRMDIEGVRACAAAHASDQADLKSALTYIRAHVADAPGWAVDAMVCAAAYDEASDLLIKELNDPYERVDALERYEDIVPPPNYLAQSLDEDNRVRALFSRPDVKAAAEKVGHRVKLPIYDWTL